MLIAITSHCLDDYTEQEVTRVRVCIRGAWLKIETGTQHARNEIVHRSPTCSMGLEHLPQSGSCRRIVLTSAESCPVRQELCHCDLEEAGIAWFAIASGQPFGEGTVEPQLALLNQHR